MFKGFGIYNILLLIFHLKARQPNLYYLQLNKIESNRNTSLILFLWQTEVSSSKTFYLLFLLPLSWVCAVLTE